MRYRVTFPSFSGGESRARIELNTTEENVIADAYSRLKARVKSVNEYSVDDATYEVIGE